MKERLIKPLLIIIGFFTLVYILVYIPFLLEEQHISVLSYHDMKPQSKKTSQDKKNNFIISTENFEKQMKYIHDHHYKTLTMDEFYCWMIEECNFPKKSVVITFDDGNRSIYDYALPILKKYNIKATSFVILSKVVPENKVGKDYIFLTKEMIEKSKIEYPGLNFQSHSYDLHTMNSAGNPIIHQLTYDELKKDIDNGLIVMNTYVISYPFGDYNNTFIQALKDSNYKMGFYYKIPFKMARRGMNLYKIPRISIAGNLGYARFKLALKYGLFSKKNLLGL